MTGLIKRTTERIFDLLVVDSLDFIVGGFRELGGVSLSMYVKYILVHLIKSFL